MTEAEIADLRGSQFASSSSTPAASITTVVDVRLRGGFVEVMLVFTLHISQHRRARKLHLELLGPASKHNRHLDATT